MKKEGEVKTKECSQCKGLGFVKKIYSFGAIESVAQCPVCEGYGFVIVEEKNKSKPNV